MDRERARRMGDRLPGRNMLEALAMGLAVPVLIVPAMLIIFHAPDMGPIWVPLLLGYLTLFTVVGGLLWKKRAKDQFHFLVGDEIFYRDYPRDLQKALKAARREGIPPEVQRTLELYSDVTGGPLPADRAERRAQLQREKEHRFALDLFELGAIDQAELVYRLKK